MTERFVQDIQHAEAVLASLRHVWADLHWLVQHPDWVRPSSKAGTGFRVKGCRARYRDISAAIDEARLRQAQINHRKERKRGANPGR